MNNTSNFNAKSDDKFEFSLVEIVEFFQESWKQLFFAAVIGAALGFGGWFFLASYKAELVLVNSTSTNTNDFSLDLVSWRSLQKNLPNLASYVLKKDKLPQDQKEIYQAMGNSQWWSNNIIVNYTNPKIDANDLANNGKNSDVTINKILTFIIFADGQNQNNSLDNVISSANFIKSGGAYLQIRDLINSYKVEVLGTASAIKNQLSQNQVDQIYIRERIKKLEELQKRYPNKNSIYPQIHNSKDSSFKYLPVETQLIAANNELNSSQEIIGRLNDRLYLISLLEKFIVLVSPKIDEELNGLILIKSLLEVEQSLRKTLAPDDLQGNMSLDQLRSQILAIESRFTNGLAVNTPPITKKIGLLNSISRGAAVGGFLMLGFLLGRKALRFLKDEKNTSALA